VKKGSVRKVLVQISMIVGQEEEKDRKENT